MVETQHSVAYKVALLKYLIDTKAWLLDPHVEKFWDFVGDTFTAKAAPQGSPELSGKELEALCKDEVDLWGEEADDPQKKRRKGHEAGSEYDLLMKKWVDMWDSMMLAYWRMEVERPGPNYKKYDIIPEIWRDGAEKLVSELPNGQTPESRLPQTAHATTRSRSDTRPPKDGIPKPSEKTAGQDGFIYDVDTLERVVESAKQRAIQQGKEEVGNAVQQIFEDSLANVVLRRLLERILLHSANAKEQTQFQEYVKLAKRKLKDAKIDAKRERVMTGPLESWGRRRKTVPDAGKKISEGPGDAMRSNATFDNANVQATASQGIGQDTQLMTNTSSNLLSQNSKKRKRDSDTLVALKSAAVQRATKQAKVAENYEFASPPVKANPSVVGKAKENVSRTVRASSRASSPLSSPGETDSEVAKDAFADEVGRRKSAGPSASDSRAESVPVSPAVITNAANTGGEQAIPGAQLVVKRTQPTTATPGTPAAVPRTISPLALQSDGREAEELSPADSSHAYRIITGAAAEAVAPAISRLEEKIDAIITRQQSQTQQPTPPPQLLSPSSSQRVAEASASTSRELMNIATALQTSDINAQSPEFVHLVTKLAKNAAEASIHAAEAAKRAAEMARDVSMVLMQIGAKGSAGGAGQE